MSTTDKQPPPPPPRLFSPPHPSLLRFFTQFKTDESKTYEMLIDTFRLRCDDDYTYGAHNHGVYGGDPRSLCSAISWLAPKAAGMLPQW